MNTTAPSQPHVALEFARRLTAILHALNVAMSGPYRHIPFLRPRNFIVAILSMMLRADQRIRSIAGKIAEGAKLPRLRVRAPRSETAPAKARKPRNPLRKLPAGPGWIIRRPEFKVSHLRAELEALLAEPGVADLIAAAPQIARYLRPVCRLVNLPDPLTGAPAHVFRPVKPKPPPKHHFIGLEPTFFASEGTRDPRTYSEDYRKYVVERVRFKNRW
jgi:hypothetical protein